MSKKNTRFIQARLVQSSNHSRDYAVVQVSWIPEKYAIVNKVLELKMGDKWEGGWRVEEVYHKAHTVEIVEARERDYKNQRKVSDV